MTSRYLSVRWLHAHSYVLPFSGEIHRLTSNFPPEGTIVVCITIRQGLPLVVGFGRQRQRKSHTCRSHCLHCLCGLIAAGGFGTRWSRATGGWGWRNERIHHSGAKWAPCGASETWECDRYTESYIGTRLQSHFVYSNRTRNLSQF